MTDYYVGPAITHEGRCVDIVAVHVGKRPTHNAGAGMVIDVLSADYGTVPHVEENCWAVRPLAGDVTVPHALEFLEHVVGDGDHLKVIAEPVPYNRLIEVAGSSAVQGL